MVIHIVSIAKRAAGKDVFSDYCSEHIEIPSISFSTVIKNIGVELGLINETNKFEKRCLQDVGNYLRENHDESYYTNKVGDLVDGKNYIINGLRHPKELKILKNKLGESVVSVGIVADKWIRYCRAETLGIVSSYMEFMLLEENKAEQQIETLLQQVDYTIDNNGTVEEFYEKINDFYAGYCDSGCHLYQP